MNTFLLASGSPRRKELLGFLDFPFDIAPPQIEEDVTRDLPPEDLAGIISREKLNWALQNRPLYDYTLAADTFLSFKGKILGKPESEDQAREMLKDLSGCRHHVITGFSFFAKFNNTIETRAVSTGVTFRKLEPEELEWYIKSREWRGAAGSYKIQGKGACLVKEIKGSWSNVVGLPLEEIYGILRLHKIV